MTLEQTSETINPALGRSDDLHRTDRVNKLELVEASDGKQSISSDNAVVLIDPCTGCSTRVLDD